MQTLTPIIHSFNTNCVPDTVLGAMKQEWIKSNSRGDNFKYDISAMKENHGINSDGKRGAQELARDQRCYIQIHLFVCLHESDI